MRPYLNPLLTIRKLKTGETVSRFELNSSVKQQSGLEVKPRQLRLQGVRWQVKRKCGNK